MKLREREVGRLRCPYCHDDLVTDEQVAGCGACGAGHHATCAIEFGRCGACATEIRPQVRLSRRLCHCGNRAVLGDTLCDLHRRESISALTAEAVLGLEQAGKLDQLAQGFALVGCLVAIPSLVGGIVLFAAHHAALAALVTLVPVLPFHAAAFALSRRAGRLRGDAYVAAMDGDHAT